MCDLQLDYICTYKMITENDEDEKGLSELLYKIQYLQLFGLTEFNERNEIVIHRKLENLYKKIENESFLDELFEFHTYNGYMTKEFMFRTMFSYDYFDLFHKLLYCYFNNLPLDNILNILKEHLKVNRDERIKN